MAAVVERIVAAILIIVRLMRWEWMKSVLRVAYCMMVPLVQSHNSLRSLLAPGSLRTHPLLRGSAEWPLHRRLSQGNLSDVETRIPTVTFPRMFFPRRQSVHLSTMKQRPHAASKRFYGQ
jgi:hypothetical protein